MEYFTNRDILKALWMKDTYGRYLPLKKRKVGVSGKYRIPRFMKHPVVRSGDSCSDSLIVESNDVKLKMRKLKKTKLKNAFKGC